jgi:hypothetical protein
MGSSVQDVTSIVGKYTIPVCIPEENKCRYEIQEQEGVPVLYSGMYQPISSAASFPWQRWFVQTVKLHLPACQADSSFRSRDNVLETLLVNVEPG